MLSGCVAGADTTPTSTDARSVSVPAADDPDLVDWAAIVTELDRRRAAAQRDPSMEAIDSFCAPMSECNEQWSDSIGYLIDNDLRMVGGHPDEIVDVVYAGTLDGSPLSEAFEVVLDVERRAVEQGVIQLVTDDGSVEQEFRPDEETRQHRVRGARPPASDPDLRVARLRDRLIPDRPSAESARDRRRR